MPGGDGDGDMITTVMMMIMMVMMMTMIMIVMMVLVLLLVVILVITMSDRCCIFFGKGVQIQYPGCHTDVSDCVTGLHLPPHPRDHGPVASHGEPDGHHDGAGSCPDCE